jgi:hypothetical protein
LVGRIDQERHRVAAAPAGEHYSGTESGQPRALQLAERTQLRCGEQLGGCVGGSCLEAGVRCSQRTCDAVDRIGRQLGRAFQEHGRGGDSAPGLRPVG